MHSEAAYLGCEIGRQAYHQAHVLLGHSCSSYAISIVPDWHFHQAVEHDDSASAFRSANSRTMATPHIAARDVSVRITTPCNPWCRHHATGRDSARDHRCGQSEVTCGFLTPAARADLLDDQLAQCLCGHALWAAPRVGQRASLSATAGLALGAPAPGPGPGVPPRSPGGGAPRGAGGAQQEAAQGRAHLVYVDECDMHLLPVMRAMGMKGPRLRVPTPVRTPSMPSSVPSTCARATGSGPTTPASWRCIS